MKQLLLFVLFLSLDTAVSAQNTINEMVIEHLMVDIGAYSYVGQMKQTPENIRILDSLDITMIIAKRKFPESGNRSYIGIDTLYSHNFPVYSYVDDEGIVFERIFQPHYNRNGILDSITCSGNSVMGAYEIYKQDAYKGGDSIVFTKSFYHSPNEFIQNDYFVRTFHHDTVQVRYYQKNIDQFQEYTGNYVNNRLVESYFESRGVYTNATTYNKLGLPKEKLGTGVTNEGGGNILTIYEYYSVPSGEKKKARLILME